MAEVRGRALGYVAVLLAGWVGARAMLNQELQTDSRPAQRVMAARPASATPLPATPPRFVQPAQPHRIAGQRQRSAFIPKFRPPPALDPWQDGGWPSGSSFPALVAGGGEPLSTGRDTPPSNALALWGKAGQPETKTAWGGSIYAYSFWRFTSGGSAALAPGAQYGGSQSGLIATLDPFGSPDRGFALLLRGAATPDGEEREIALGVRWYPDAAWPLSLSAERRLRANAPDGFAAYVAGGIDAVPLPLGFKLDAFGQAGYATGAKNSAFFDTHMRAMRPLVRMGDVPVSLGAGIWAGGQKGAARADIGPTLAAKVDAGPATFLIQLDWRLRAAGNAEPKDGVALTVSTGF